MNSYKFKTLDHEFIERLHVDEEKSLKAIANEVGVSPSLIKKSLQSRGVPLRSRSEAQRLRRDKRGMQHNMALKAEITHLYLEEKLSANACAKKVGIAHQTVGYLLDLWGIPKRNDLRKVDKSDELPTDEIVRLYVDEEIPAPAIAYRYDVSAPTIYKLLRDNGVQIRTLSVALTLSHKQRVEKATASTANGGTANGGTANGGTAEKPNDISEEDILVQRKKRWLPDVVVRKNMSIQEMRDAGLTIDEIAEIKGQSRVVVFRALQNSRV